MDSFGEFAETGLKKQHVQLISLKFKKMGSQCSWLKGQLATKYFACILLRMRGFKIRFLESLVNCPAL